MWEKEKLLLTSNLSFSHVVFIKLVRQIRKSQGLFGKGLKTLVCHGLTNQRPPAHKVDALTLSHMSNSRLFQTDKSLQTTISNFMKTTESSPNG